MTDMAKLAVRFEAETAKFRKQLEQNNRELEKFRRSTQKQLGFIRQAFAVGLGTGLADGVKAALRSVPQFVSQSLESVDQIQKLEQRLGASTEALSEYRHVAKLTGVEFGTLTTGWQRMTRRIAEAAKGTGEAQKALQELGLDVQALNQLAPDQQFEALADAIQSVKNPADQVRLAMKLFDSEGVALIQTMEGGADAIRAARTEARELGLSLSREQVNQAADFNDEWERLRATFTGAAQSIVVDLIPTLTELAGTLREDVAPAIRKVLEFFDLVEPQAVKMREVERLITSVQRGIAATQRAVGVQQAAGNQQAVDALTESLQAQQAELDRLQAKLDRYRGSAQGAATTTPPVGLRIPAIAPAGASGARASASSDADQFARRFQALQDALDPVSAKTRDYLENVELLDRAWVAGQISGERHSELMAKLATDLEAVSDAQSALAADRGRAQQLIKDLDAGSSIRDQIIEVQRLRDTFPDLADSLADVELELNAKWDEIGRPAVEAADDIRDAWQDLGPVFASQFEDAIVEGRKFGEVLRGLEQDLLRIFTRKLLTEPIGNAVSDFAGDLFSGFNLPGFATGGSFMVGGSGGTDSKLVAFKATPGERVDVRTPGQQRATSGATIVQNFTFALPADNVDFRRSADQVAREAARRMRRAQAPH